MATFCVMGIDLIILPILIFGFTKCIYGWNPVEQLVFTAAQLLFKVTQIYLQLQQVYLQLYKFYLRLPPFYLRLSKKEAPTIKIGHLLQIIIPCSKMP